MINFERFTLKNGLKVLYHHDKTSPIVAMNILYNVGARDEDPELTGFAHLFEHLMFGGSLNIPKYDVPLEKVGGENNAFTNNDFTNYYLTVPVENIETAFWLESDRMLNLAFSEKSLEVQRKVVIEEYKQRYLNQPYGDIWLLLRPLIFKVHPYRWATIGKDIEHIEKATMEDVKSFYTRFYNPSNAILSIVGDLSLDYVKELCVKWFESIEAGNPYQRSLPVEPPQTKPIFMEVERDVPVNALYKIYRMCSRTDADYHATDLLSDVLSNGNSSRLHLELHKKKGLFSQISAFISGDLEPGFFVVAGYLNDGVDMKLADEAVTAELNSLIVNGVEEEELQKVQNKVEANLVYSEISGLDKAMNLCYFELLGDAQMANAEIDKYLMVTTSDVQRVARNIFTSQNSTTLYYRAKTQDTQNN